MSAPREQKITCVKERGRRRCRCRSTLLFMWANSEEEIREGQFGLWREEKEANWERMEERRKDRHSSAYVTKGRLRAYVRLRAHVCEHPTVGVGGVAQL